MLDEVGREAIATAVARERAAIAAGDSEAYFAVLSADAMFMPPNSPARAGEELRDWLGTFVRDFRVEWLSFLSTELEAVEDLAYHTFAYTWRVTPRSGGEEKVSSGKGLHILRRQADGSWTISREIWNGMPHQQ
jgi:ketosteroid isomerase-like protein